MRMNSDERSSSNERTAGGTKRDRTKFGEQLSIISEKNSQTADNSMAQDFLRNFRHFDHNPDIVNLKINNT